MDFAWGLVSVVVVCKFRPARRFTLTHSRSLYSSMVGNMALLVKAYVASLHASMPLLLIFYFEECMYHHVDTLSPKDVGNVA